MRTRCLLTVLIFLSLVLSVSAHEFWLEPDTFHPQPDQSVSLDIKVGMNFAGDLWKGDLKNILQLPMISGSHKDSLLPKTGLDEPVIKRKFPEAGQYLIGLTNKNSFIELSAKKFEKYVLSEGLGHIVEQRKKLGESKKVGRELYRRCAKVLLQQGDSNDSTYSEVFGFPVELIALSNPYKAGTQQLKFRLDANGKPLPKATVVIWHKDGEELKRTELLTDEKGEFTFLVRPEGIWMISSVHMERADDTDKAEWQSYWASYTFGYN